MLKRKYLLFSLIIQSCFILVPDCKAENPGDNFVPFVNKGKWGYCDRSKNIVIPPKFDGADLFHNGLAFVSFKGKDGIINSKGEFVLEPKYINLDNFKGGCVNECILFYSSHPLHFRTFYKNYGYSIVEIKKVDTSTIECKTLGVFYKIFKPDGSELVKDEITELSYYDNIRYGGCIKNTLFRIDSVYYFWNELDSIYLLGVYNELEWKGLSILYGQSIKRSVYIEDTQGQLVYASFQTLAEKDNTKYSSPEIIVWDKKMIENNSIKTVEELRSISIPLEYLRLTTKKGILQKERNGIYTLYLESGELIDKSRSDDYIIYNENYMIISNRGSKSIYRISDGKKIVGSSFSSVNFITDQLFKASPYNNRNDTISYDIYKFGVFNVDGKIVIDTIYKSIYYHKDIPIFQCRKDNMDYFFDLNGDYLFESEPNSLQIITPNIFQFKDANGCKWIDLTSKKTTPVRCQSKSRAINDDLFVISSINKDEKGDRKYIHYVINRIGDIIIPPGYSGYNGIDTFDTKTKQLLVKSNGKYGIINYKNELILPPHYIKIIRSNNRVILEDNNAMYLTNLTFNNLSKPCERISSLSQDYFGFRINDMDGVMDRNGNFILQPKYRHVFKINKDLVLVQYGPDNILDIGWVSLTGMEYFNLN